MTRRARELHAALTPAETALWAELRRERLGVRFRRQLVFDKRFILDFYAPSLKLAVEVDGGQHAAEADKDAQRTAYLVRRDVSVLRFWNNEVNENMDGVLSAITDVIAALSSPLTPLRSGG
ncbi:MAG: endonuclease domain-containing protein, partial [Alphaproteobacteria bacterium]|nr:endonuclease domain-containing protein [Alphaproteobacteria bacterium]